MNKKYIGKKKLLLCMLITSILIVTSLTSVTGQTQNDSENTTSNSAIRSRALPSWFYKLVNDDWNYWSKSPNMYSIPSGNVGIGTSSPSSKLQVAGNIDAYGFSINGTAIGTSSDSYWSADGSNIYYNTGNVGIGTISPVAKLDVAGMLKINSFKMTTGATDGYVLTSDGSGVGTWQPASGGSGGIGGSGTTNKISKFTSSDTIGNSIITESSSKIGIGTSSPTEKLDVAGTIKATGFKMPISPTAGYVLTCDSNGVGTWQPVGGGSDGIGGSGTINKLPKMVGPTTIGDSIITESSSKIGIGTSSPTEKLDVAGTIKATSFKMPTNAVTGYVLTCNSQGVGTWQPASGGGGGIGGSGSTNYIPRFAGSTTLGNSIIYQTSDSIGIGTTNPEYTLHVDGTIYGNNDGDLGVSGEGYYGVIGYSEDVEGIGVVGWSTDYEGFGLAGVGENGSGLWATTLYGLYAAQFEGDVLVNGTLFSLDPFGIAGVAGVSEGYGIYGGSSSGYAGWFEGDVNINGTLSKQAGSFKIDHPLDPENKYLYHSFVESPDMKNIYDGTITLDENGEAIVELPDYFEALNKDFRYQLTCIGGYAPVYISKEVHDNMFKIAGGTPGLKVSWQVTGIRHDTYAEENRIPVEEYKTDVENEINPQLEILK